MNPYTSRRGSAGVESSLFLNPFLVTIPPGVEEEDISVHDKTGIRWSRVLVAGVLAEAGIVVLIGTLAIVYRLAFSATDLEFDAFISRAGYYVGVFGGGFATFGLALWVSRVLRTDFPINGLLVGCVAALLHIGVLTGSGAGFQTAYAIADALKLIGGLLGGYFARYRFEQSLGNAGVEDHAP
jgi:hypothetical protein